MISDIKTYLYLNYQNVKLNELEFLVNSNLQRLALSEVMRNNVKVLSAQLIKMGCNIKIILNQFFTTFIFLKCFLHCYKADIKYFTLKDSCFQDKVL